jgi:CheY-like chemotaxis protein
MDISSKLYHYPQESTLALCSQDSTNSAFMILVVDDDDAYELLMPRLFKVSNSEACFQFLGDGEQAIHYLTGEGKYADRSQFPFPKIVLLDLRMPRINGFEFLEWKRNQPQFSELPVVVWSSSELPEDMERARSLGAIDYIVKPAVGHELVEAIERIYGHLKKARGTKMRDGK